jgi:hypothetical protein
VRHAGWAIILPTLISNEGGVMRIKRSLSAIIISILVATVPMAASAQFSVGVGFTIGTPPPPLPVYSQPPAPYPNWQWQPGYWGWGAAGYYWVPGTWVAPPTAGLYWTPGYWGYTNGYYGWNAGYWGASVGFYGGINYGFGYPGVGFYGGAWGPRGFAYNTAVANVNKTVIHNTYNKTVINKNVCNNCKNVSYNGGKGGISAKPTQAQIQARKNGRAPTSAQVNQAKAAAQDRNLAYNVNHGKPPVTAVQKPVSDPKQLPKYAPVTAQDKQLAQKQVKTTASQPAHKSSNTMQSTQHQPATTMNKPAAQHHNQPSGTMQSQQMHPHPAQRPPAAAHPQGQMRAHPQRAMQPYGGHPQGQRPPGGGQRPPGGNPERPSGGNNKNKPPQR